MDRPTKPLVRPVRVFVASPGNLATALPHAWLPESRNDTTNFLGMFPIARRNDEAENGPYRTKTPIHELFDTYANACGHVMSAAAAETPYG